MLSISRKTLLVIAMFTLAWALSSCKGISDQLSVRLETGAKMADFSINYPSTLDTNVVMSEPQPLDQSGCFEGGCHADLKAAQEQFVHPIFEQDQCLACHTADHTDPEFTPERTLELCVSCHPPESLGNSHVVGAGVIDPRNGETLTCLSCHGHHSGAYNAMLTMNGKGELCVSCHTEFLN